MRLLREASSKGSPQSAMGMAWTWGGGGGDLGVGQHGVVVLWEGQR